MSLNYIILKEYNESSYIFENIGLTIIGSNEEIFCLMNGKERKICSKYDKLNCFKYETNGFITIGTGFFK